MQSLLYLIENSKTLTQDVEAGEVLDFTQYKDAVYYLKRGLIANVSIQDGKVNTAIKILAPGVLLGVEQIFDDLAVSSTYISLSDSSLLGVPSELFKYWMNQNVELRLHVLINLHKQLESVEVGMQMPQHLNPTQRLLNLAGLIRKSGIHGEEVHLKASELARLCRCTVETLRREWKDLIADVPARLLLE